VFVDVNKTYLILSYLTGLPHDNGTAPGKTTQCVRRQKYIKVSYNDSLSDKSM